MFDYFDLEFYVFSKVYADSRSYHFTFYNNFVLLLYIQLSINFKDKTLSNNLKFINYKQNKWEINNPKTLKMDSRIMKDSALSK